MMTRLKNKLRISGFEDRLQRELGLTAETSSWVSRLVQNCADSDGMDVLSVRGDLLAETLVWHLERSGYMGLLEKLADDSPALADSLSNYRSPNLASAA